MSRPSRQYAPSLASGFVVSAVCAVLLRIFRDFLVDIYSKYAGKDKETI